ncbi:MAG: serine--tRNA ligase [Desulfovibrionaceae bacterium]|nr:serine--tRNA ligase [Desulfovibrionaceae bacterium]
MLDLKLVQKNPEILAKALKDRHSDLDVAEFQQLDARRRELLQQVEDLKSKRNQASQAVAEHKRKGEDILQYVQELGKLSDTIKALDLEVNAAKEAVYNWLLRCPNIPDASVPIGRDETDNPELRRVGTPRAFSFPVREHGELGAALGGFDFERASRLTGSRFVVSFGWAALLDRALINFFLDQHTLHEDYIEVAPPYIVNSQTMTGTGQLPKFEEDLFKLRENDYYLIPTAEVPLTNLHAQETLSEADLPRAYCAATPCFRSEAGSAGKDTRGIIRMHQFNKVEMVRFSHPDNSFDQLELMTSHACHLLELLELPYRVITLCTGDMGFGATKTYDVEVWLPAQKTYREISSCSNCGDFQARRAGIRFKSNAGKTSFVHTLNGSGLPTGRTIAALIENGQQQDGSIVLPKVLAPYLHGQTVIEPKS